MTVNIDVLKKAAQGYKSVGCHTFGNSINDAIEEIKKLREVCGEAYQFAGAYDAPEKVLDNLSDAANGRKLRHKTFLPVPCPYKESK